MRLVSLLFIMILSVSCGQDSGSTSSSSPERGICSLNGNAVACESIRGADGQGIDLLDSMIDVPIKIENADITFLADKAATDQGRRIKCSVGVKDGEVYRFALRGNKLLLMTSEGSFEMERINEGDGIVGSTWAWKGYVDQGTHVIQQITFLNKSRMIMKKSCEL
jgi:hypothetical protein